MSVSTAIKALKIIVYIIANLHVTCVIRLSATSNPKKWVQCEDCARYCRSDFCCEMHKRPQSDELRSRCDLIKYYDRCCRQYREKRTDDKLLSHTFALSKCPHCSDVLIDEGLHSCYIQPLKPGEHSKKNIDFDFETMHENGKHTANYVCAISQDGEEFTADWVDCVDKMVKHFRRPKFDF